MNKEEYKELLLPVGETPTGNLRTERKIKIHSSRMAAKTLGVQRMQELIPINR